MCRGIDYCSKKNCLEQERCVVYEPTHIEYHTRRRGAKKKKKQQCNELKLAACKIDIKMCSNERACEILGQCVLDHPLVKANKHASKELRKKGDIQRVVNIVARLMPSLNKPGKKIKPCK